MKTTWRKTHIQEGCESVNLEEGKEEQESRCSQQEDGYDKGPEVKEDLRISHIISGFTFSVVGA